ncbi:hypothetical protein KOR42_05830 [Thalassoglobus neptunius]|uniref:Uncharacterized protein n=1 Tax=Thalassoglobus neptunius TaxID=1938619 RepID=A0A5C5X4V1_9PLAN|nr:hypothetical protein KOR42_05830 [Thalassoglobus neptunius]
MGERGMSKFPTNKQWSDQFIPHIKMCLGFCLSSIADWEEDAKRNTDLFVMRAADVRVGCRVRRMKYISRNSEFTVRFRASNGGKSEFGKILEGWGEHLFYGFGSDETQLVEQWSLIDLSVFRGHVTRHMSTHGGEIPGKLIANRGSTPTQFRAFRFCDFPSDLVTQSSHNLPFEIQSKVLAHGFI